MRMALEEAEQAFAEGEVPIGAVVVCEGALIARAHNRVEALANASAHAEMLCLTQAAAALGNWRLAKCTLYCTVEPCAMCAGAMLLARLSTLVWGARDLRHGAHGSWTNLLDISHPTHRIEVRKGVLEEAASALLVNFFKMRREASSARNAF